MSEQLFSYKGTYVTLSQYKRLEAQDKEVSEEEELEKLIEIEEEEKKTTTTDKKLDYLLK